MSMRQLAELAVREQVISAADLPKITDWSQVRNAAVHTWGEVSRHTAQQIVKGVQALLRQMSGSES